MKKMLAIYEDLYNDIVKTLMDFEGATDDDTDPEWLSDGEWLDVFYKLLIRVEEEADGIVM